MLTLDTDQLLNMDEVTINEVLNGVYTPRGKTKLPEPLYCQICSLRVHEVANVVCPVKNTTMLSGIRYHEDNVIISGNNSHI